MKRLFIKTIVMCICLWSHLAQSQNINKAEYFVDTDPGYGLAINIPVTPATQLSNVSFTADLGTVSAGFHSLYMRVRDANGKWSQTYNRPFYKETLPATLTNITKAEYFIDTDPGYGLAINIPVTPASQLSNVSFTADLGTVSAGFHSLYMRIRDVNGKWSQTYNRPFYKETLPATLTNITKAEYFIDTDPGFGNANKIEITPGTSLSSEIYIVNLNSVSNGFHSLNMRVKDDNGNWSQVYTRPFYRDISPKLANITNAEYFIDTDPGFGLATSVSVTPSETIDESFSVDLSLVNSGVHNLFVRVKDANGSWSLTSVQSFTISVVTGTVTVQEMEPLNAFPNPSASGIFRLDFGQNQPDKIEVINTGSQIVYSGKALTELDLSSMPSGVYFVRVIIGETIAYKKIVKE